MDGREIWVGAFKEENFGFREGDGSGGLTDDGKGGRESEEEFSLCGLESVGHFLDVVAGGGAVDAASCTDGGEEGDGIPDCVGGEDGDGVGGEEAMVVDEGGAEVGGFFFDLCVGEGFFGDGVFVFAGWLDGLFEEVFPGCYIGGDWKKSILMMDACVRSVLILNSLFRCGCSDFQSIVFG
jgi:hypothetical protein